MRVGVIGIGALGSVYAYALAAAGHDVQVVARESAASAISANGIRVRLDGEALSAQVEVVERLHEPELVLLCVKAQDARAALETHAASFGDATLVVIQNGLQGFATAAEFHPAERCVGGISLIAANLAEPGIANIGAPQRTMLGRPGISGSGSGSRSGGDGDCPAEAAVQLATQILNEATSKVHSSMQVVEIENFEGMLWSKLLLNVNNALPAVVNLSVQDIGLNPQLARIQAGAMQEAAQVGEALGVNWGTLGFIDSESARGIATDPIETVTELAQRMAAANGDTPNFASTWQSISRGRATEVDFLNGEVVARGKAAGLPTPVNEMLVSAVHEVELTGTFLDPGSVQ